MRKTCSAILQVMPNAKQEQFLAPKRAFQRSILKTTIYLSVQNIKKPKEHFTTKITFIII